MGSFVGPSGDCDAGMDESALLGRDVTVLVLRPSASWKTATDAVTEPLFLALAMFDIVRADAGQFTTDTGAFFASDEDP